LKLVNGGLTMTMMTAAATTTTTTASNSTNTTISERLCSCHKSNAVKQFLPI
jgi:hypothetical protein